MLSHRAAPSRSRLIGGRPPSSSGGPKLSYVELHQKRMSRWAGPREHVDHVLAASVDECGEGVAIEVIEPAAQQGEALARQLRHGRRKVEPAVEPWLHRMVVARGHVGEVTRHQ